MVLNSVSSPITKRVYNMALNEFMAWFQQEPRGSGLLTHQLLLAAFANFGLRAKVDGRAHFLVTA
jgi:hypothetical protein